MYNVSVLENLMTRSKKALEMYFEYKALGKPKSLSLPENRSYDFLICYFCPHLLFSQEVTLSD